MRVREIMSAPVVTVRGDDPLENVARTMLERGIGSVVVVGRDGSAAGILTERDFVEHEELPYSGVGVPLVLGTPVGSKPIEAIYADARRVAARKVMRPLAATLHEDDLVERALDLMVRRGVKHLAVVRDGRPVGMVSHHDFLALTAHGGALARA